MLLRAPRRCTRVLWALVTEKLLPCPLPCLVSSTITLPSVFFPVLCIPHSPSCWSSSLSPSLSPVLQKHCPPCPAPGLVCFHGHPAPQLFSRSCIAHSYPFSVLSLCHLSPHSKWRSDLCLQSQKNGGSRLSTTQPLPFMTRPTPVLDMDPTSPATTQCPGIFCHPQGTYSPQCSWSRSEYCARADMELSTIRVPTAPMEAHRTGFPSPLGPLRLQVVYLSGETPAWGPGP